MPVGGLVWGREEVGVAAVKFEGCGAGEVLSGSLVRMLQGW